jgi:hypothetical protein
MHVLYPCSPLCPSAVPVRGSAVRVADGALAPPRWSAPCLCPGCGCAGSAGDDCRGPCPDPATATRPVTHTDTHSIEQGESRGKVSTREVGEAERLDVRSDCRNGFQTDQARTNQPFHRQTHHKNNKMVVCHVPGSDRVRVVVCGWAAATPPAANPAPATPTYTQRIQPYNERISMLEEGDKEAHCAWYV